MNKSEGSNPPTSETGVDRISSLPDDILELILSRILINQVVRTSTLSKRWSHLWKSIPSFPSLRIELVTSKNTTTKFTNFVEWALANQAPLDSLALTLPCYNYHKSELFNRCVQSAMMRQLKSLDLTISFWHDPYGMVKCDSLESLKICINNTYFKWKYCLPDCVRFSSLRALELDNVDISTHGLSEWFLHSLVEDFSLINCLFTENDDVENHDPLCISCPMLKALRIRNLKCRCVGSYEPFVVSCPKFVVSCPQLAVLEYVSSTIGCFLFKNLHSLKKAAITTNDDKWCNYVAFGLVNGAHTLLAAISHAETWSLSNNVIQAISTTGFPRENCPASLPLKTMELTTKFGIFAINTIIRILKCCPRLESLRLIIQKEFLWPHYWNGLDEDETRTILTRRLKRVEFLEFNGEKLKTDIARVFLEHGNVLEEMVFSWSDRVEYHEKSTEAMNIVSQGFINCETDWSSQGLMQHA